MSTHVLTIETRWSFSVDLKEALDKIRLSDLTLNQFNGTTSSLRKILQCHKQEPDIPPASMMKRCMFLVAKTKTTRSRETSGATILRRKCGSN